MGRGRQPVQARGGAMTWFKVDDHFAFHSKALAAGNEALGAWVRAGSWCCGELTDGAIPEHVAAAIAPPDVWARLVAARLVVRTDTGYQLHDFLAYNPSAEEVRAERRAAIERREKARAAKRKPSADPSPDGSPDARPNVAEVIARTSPDPSPDDRPSDRAPRPDPTRPDPIEDQKQQQRAREGEGDPESASARVLGSLRSHPSLRPIALVKVAHRVADDLVARPKPWPLVEQAIADLASKAADAEALGAPWASDRMVSALHAFVARAQPRVDPPSRDDAPRSGTRTYAPPEPVRTGTKVLTFDDPPRPAGGPLPRLREVPRPVPAPAPAAPFVPPPGALDTLLDGIGNGGRA